jgi:hypothetical protein
MKVIKVKRLVYSKLGCNEVIYGGIEYDGNLSDENILNSVHELGKTKWLSANWVGPEDEGEDELWLLKPDSNNPNIKYPTYHIFVDTFYRYEKTWWDNLCDNIKRILRI